MSVVRKGSPTTTILSMDIKRAVIAASAKEDRSISNYLERVIRNHFEKLEGGKNKPTT